MRKLLTIAALLITINASAIAPTLPIREAGETMWHYYWYKIFLAF